MLILVILEILLSMQNIWIRWDEDIPGELKNKILKACMPSVYMQHYLEEQPMKLLQAAELVYKSPATLWQKLDLIGELADLEDFQGEVQEELDNPGVHITREDHIDILEKNRIGRVYQILQEAVQNFMLQNGEIFYLTDAWYDEDYKDEHDCGVTAVTSLEAAMEAIHREYAFEEWDQNTEVWTILDKFIPGVNGQMIHTYRYYLIYDEPVYFTKMSPKWEEPHKDTAASLLYGDGEGGDIHYLVPFPIGTILSVSSFPFSPEKPGVLIENFEEFVEVLCRDEDGNWQIANLQDRMEWGFYRPPLSSLYRIKPYSLPLKEDEDTLQEISHWLYNNEERGHQFWNVFEHAADEIPNNEEKQEIEKWIAKLGRTVL